MPTIRPKDETSFPAHISLPLRLVFSRKERELHKLRNSVLTDLYIDSRSERHPPIKNISPSKDHSLHARVANMSEKTLRAISHAYAKGFDFSCTEQIKRNRNDDFIRFVATFFETAKKEKSSYNIPWDKVALGISMITKRPLGDAEDDAYHHALVKLMMQTNKYPTSVNVVIDDLNITGEVKVDDATNEFFKEHPELIDDYIDVAYERKIDVLDMSADFYREYRNPNSAHVLLDGVL